VNTTLDLDTLTLAFGGHEDRSNGLCLLEAVAWFAGEPHTDHPACVSPVLGAFGRSLNDILPDEKRQQLRPYITLLPGTAGDDLDQVRGYLALDWLIRIWTPAWLDLAGLSEEARALRDLRQIADRAAARSARPAVLAARDKAAAAGDDAGDAAGAAAWAAAGAAAGAAARDDAWDDAWDAARAAAWDAAWAAARAAAGAAAFAAAFAAARDALAPTVNQLQDSAITLFGTMIRPGGNQ